MRRELSIWECGGGLRLARGRETMRILNEGEAVMTFVYDERA